MSSSEQGHSLKNQTVEKIKAYVVRHRLKPGDRLPPERKMAEDFRVSRTVIRDAVKTLDGLGIIEVRHRVGIFVANFNGDSFAKHLSGGLILNRHTAESLFQVRQVLETAIARWAAENCNEIGAEKLRRVMAETKKCLSRKGDKTCFGELDRRFHILLAEISDNPVVLELMTNLLSYLRVYSQYTHSIPGRVYESAGQHESIIQAVCDQDPLKAGKAMDSHLRSVYDALSDAWQFLDPEQPSE
jgi:GntR family transcriptional regulator, transcriptional repressor for pyruvate dehydrogenase complex